MKRCIWCPISLGYHNIFYLLGAERLNINFLIYYKSWYTYTYGTVKVVDKQTNNHLYVMTDKMFHDMKERIFLVRYDSAYPNASLPKYSILEMAASV